MTRSGPWIDYAGVHELRGPLAVVTGVSGVGWDEYVLMTIADGSQRHGLVLDVDRDMAVIQVLEGTSGMDLSRTRIRFSGEPLRIAVGTGWLGRTCNGRGDPIDGGPPVTAHQRAAVNGDALNPVHRQAPAEPVLTGVSVIDGLITLVRGQKLAVFSLPGLPHLRLACQVAAQATVGSEQFSVVFAGIGLTHADASYARNVLEPRSAAGELAMFVNTADDPVIERLLTPRIALTVAEHLAFDCARHVLVVLSDMTNYAEALRQVSAARGEIPARRAYPGYLYSDLASLYERCGRITDRQGSVTVLPILTMPGGDITHPVPDLTGYITEGQIIFSAEMHRHGIYPPVDALSSLSRLMRRGAGPGRTREDHLPLASQLLAALSKAQHVRGLAELIGTDALTPIDRSYLFFQDGFATEFVDQRPDESRSLTDTLDRAWDVACRLPRSELSMLADELVDSHGKHCH